MTVKEARGIYGAQLREYNIKLSELSKKKQELDERMTHSDYNSDQYAKESVVLELSCNAVKDKQKEYQAYMDQLLQQWDLKFNEVVNKQQADAAEDYAEDMGKIMLVARRIMRGDIVPAKDEKKLMEFDSDLYQIAKSVGMMAQLEKRKKHKSLWDDEEKKELEDPNEVANDQDAIGGAPDIVSVDELLESSTDE